MNQHMLDTKALKKSMIDAGFSTISSLSTASNVNRNTLGQVLEGKAQPSAYVMLKIPKQSK